MFKVAHRPLPLTDHLSIYWWRFVIVTTRRLNRYKLRALPVVRPLVPLVWIPFLALMVGLLLGWAIAIA